MMTRAIRIGGWTVSVITVLACSGVINRSSVVPLRERPALPEGAAVEIFPSTTPAYAWEDVASGEAQCNDRAVCFELLKAEARKVGADTIYGFVEQRQAPGQNPNVIMRATLARRIEGADAGAPQLIVP